MISAEFLVFALTSLSVVVLAGNGVFCLIYPQQAIDRLSHNVDALPRVMGGRYLGMAAIGAGAGYLAGAAGIAFVFAVYGLVGLIDAAIYGARKEPFAAHAVAAILSFVVSGTAGLSMIGAS
ncbi:MAG: hypothetical protein KDJ77_08685 [Rhodobiaceae bacterium]|nr:hypothetical protein [Rhodobiaceae bacterium]